MPSSRHTLTFGNSKTGSLETPPQALNVVARYVSGALSDAEHAVLRKFYDGKGQYSLTVEKKGDRLYGGKEIPIIQKFILKGFVDVMRLPRTDTVEERGKTRVFVEYSWETTDLGDSLLDNLFKPKATLTPTPPPQDTSGLDLKVERVLAEVLDGVVNQKLGKPGSILRGLKVTVGGSTGSYSDGLHATERSLGYTFTLRFPRQVKLQGSCTLDLSELPGLVAQRVDAGIPAVEAALSKANLDTLVPQVLKDLGVVPSDNWDIPEEVKDRVSEELDAEVQQSTEAYSQEGDVDLPEYPGVYLRWRLNLKGAVFGKATHQGLTFTVPLEIQWEATPSHWTFDPDTRGSWNRIRLLKRF
jgi:hypothetical protein